MGVKSIHHNDYEPVEGSMSNFLTAYCLHKTSAVIQPDMSSDPWEHREGFIHTLFYRQRPQLLVFHSIAARVFLIFPT
jgi:hypothetical protein